MRPQKTVFYFLHGLWTLVFVACVFSSAANAADLQIVQGEDAYVGQEIVLSLQGSLLSQKPLFEWSVSGDVKSVLLKNGGAEFAFTPINTSAIDIEAVAKNHELFLKKPERKWWNFMEFIMFPKKRRQAV